MMSFPVERVQSQLLKFWGRTSMTDLMKVNAMHSPVSGVAFPLEALPAIAGAMIVTIAGDDSRA